MFHSRSLNNKINFLHERALRITYGDRSSSFENLLKKENSVSIHHRNIQALATGHGVKVGSGPGTRDLRTLGSGTQDSPEKVWTRESPKV